MSSRRLCSLVGTCMILAAAILACFTSLASAGESPRPNVILVMTDDQGYGDVACHGNPLIGTPALDKLYGQSVRLTNYHVDPTCSPTRSALVTGRYSCRTGVWHTIMGRSLLRRDEVTFGDLFAAAGYRTGAFGKWHLGDNYPYRPHDRGFHESLVNGGGGITQTPDYWGNTYFSPTLYHNGKPEPSDGYCTDVFFDAAIRFINDNRDGPFFVYLPTNVPHGPWQVADKYSKPYREMGVPKAMADFYGMLTNFDENMARLMARLDQLNLANNTILIFTTDNGTAGRGFNCDMRGRKGSQYDGGHRVPFFIRWPARLRGGRDIHALTAHIDVVPTLLELCNVPAPEGVRLDGKSLAALLLDADSDWSDRTLFVQSHRIEHPQPWRQSAVMTQRWRLIDGKELYDMTTDAEQKQDVSAEHPEVVARLRKAYEAWYEDVSGRFDEYCEIVLGSPQENPARLTCHDWHTENGPVPWNQGHIRNRLKANGYWAVEVQRAGRYRITLREQPELAEFMLRPGTARLKIGDAEATAPIPKGITAVGFGLKLPAGKTRLQTWLDEKDGPSRGAYFVEVEYLGE